MKDSAAEFEAHRARLLGLGYRMLGSVAEAEDVVQETYLRWHRTPRAEVREPGPWLSTTMARLCIDELRARKTRREAYVGPWLPEPWLGDAPDAEDAARPLELADDLSVAFLLMLERLSPEERAAFLLHDIFEAGYAEIAGTLGKSEAAVRQIVSRARGHITAQRPRFRARRSDQEALARKFQQALAMRDDGALLALFKPDATLVSDGGGKALAALRPIHGAEKIVRFFLGITRRPGAADLTIDICWINQSVGLLAREGSGEATASLCFEVQDGLIAAIYAVRNPDKLERLTAG